MNGMGNFATYHLSNKCYKCLSKEILALPYRLYQFSFPTNWFNLVSRYSFRILLEHHTVIVPVLLDRLTQFSSKVSSVSAYLGGEIVALWQRSRSSLGTIFVN